MPLPTALILLAALLAAAPASAELRGLARVEDDATLRLRGQRIVLWGVHVPPTRDACSQWQRPPRCTSQAALMLEQVIDGFVRCERRGRLDDGRIVARCHANYGHFDAGIDLAAWLLNRGWAVAGADAPPDYRVGEAVARRHGLGIWGLPLALQP